jgi:hypothetical protein
MAIRFFLRSFVCFWQDLNLAHDAEERRAAVLQLDRYGPALNSKTYAIYRRFFCYPE